MASEIKRRYGFLSAWCALLKKRISYCYPERDEEIWDLRRKQLWVFLPTHYDNSDSEEEEEADLFFYEQEDEEDFQLKLQNIREALALLAAVAHVDQSAWKYLLTTYCGLKLGEEGQEEYENDLPAEFILFLNLEGRESLKWEDTFVFDLARFCGPRQRKRPSRPFLNALARISYLNPSLQEDGPGVNVFIPVRVFFGGMHIKSVDGPMEVFMDVWRAQEKIREKWEKYEQNFPDDSVESGQTRCTFVLEPMIADFNDFMICSEVAKTTKWLVANNLWFSQFSLWLRFDRDLENDECAAKKALGQLMSSVFDSTRRSIALAGFFKESIQQLLRSSPLQLGTVHFECDDSVRAQEFAAICSALAVNHTTRKFSMRLEMSPDDQANSNQWWRWLAYGLFSKRAKMYSTLETLSLFWIGSMSGSDMEAFTAVLSSDHPEEKLCGLPRGQVDERDVAIKRDSPIRWQFNEQGQPRQRIQRNDLVFCREKGVTTSGGNLKSLNIGFGKFEAFDSSGLPQFLEAIGPSLEILTLEDLLAVELTDICKFCPNLKELSFRAGPVAARFHFYEYQTNGDPLPTLSCDWRDIAALSADLSNLKSPITKCLRRLRVRLTDLFMGWSSLTGTRYLPRIESDLQALIQMLDVNDSLEYVDVVVPDKYEHYAEAFKMQHLTPTRRATKLPASTKIAFLSVVVPSDSKKRVRRTRSAREQLDENLLSKVFAFAAPPVLRQVYFRKKTEAWSERKEVPI